MKAVLEFGNRGGAHIENLVFPNVSLAIKTARAIVASFENDPHAVGTTDGYWLVSSKHPRYTWQSETHFVAISVLDGVMRGPASAALWRKPNKEEL